MVTSVGSRSSSRSGCMRRGGGWSISPGRSAAARRWWASWPAPGISIYFCDPHSPWQRGSNENTNGLLRQYLPKGSDLSIVTREELDAIQDSLNGRRRRTLSYLTPSEKLAEFLALTA